MIRVFAALSVLAVLLAPSAYAAPDFRSTPKAPAPAAAPAAQAAPQANVCAWLIETEQDNNERDVSLWLESDTDIDFLIKIGGKGIVSDGLSGNSPETATYHLSAGGADKAWSYGLTLVPPGLIDFVVDLHQSPADIFSDKPTPVLASFTFDRKVPANEKNPPPVFAKKQCRKMAVLQPG
jgi:hypothetical protein